MGPSLRGYRATATTGHVLLLLLPSIFTSSQSVDLELPKSMFYNTSVDGREFATLYFTGVERKILLQPGILTFSGNATVNQLALQITPDTSGDHGDTFFVNKTGRVFYSNPFPLWVPSASGGKYVASFNTWFKFNLFRVNRTGKGEGLAFVIASRNDSPPPGSDGGYLGLTNASTDGRATNGFVAVELDTVKQPFDADDNHVGINVNGVHSICATPLAPLGIQLAPSTGNDSGNYYVWVEYDGTTRHLWVYMSYQLNVVLEWIMTVETLNEGGGGGGSSGSGRNLGGGGSGSGRNIGGTGSGRKLGVVVGVPCGIVVAMALGVSAGLYCIRNRRNKVGKEGSTVSVFNETVDLTNIPGLPKEFDYKELSKGTNDFDDRMKLGQGGYGATMPGENGQSVEVAVKQFPGANAKGQEDFLAELSIINRLRHRNLVKLVGWCRESGVLLLVYDYMPNGSLDRHIFGGLGAPVLSWEQRYNVVSSVASALNYLHHEYDQMVIHRDIKPSNIMLDSAFNARLGDFGLARALDTDKSSYTDNIGVPGTLGYIAPECFHTGRATRESDVFAFGAVILEIVCGRRLSCDSPAGFGQLLEWVWGLHGAGRILDAVDPRLAGEFDEEDAVRLLLLGLACGHPNSVERPRTRAILQNLAHSVPPLAVPPARPAFMWPVEPAADQADADDETAMSRRGVTGTTVAEVDQELPTVHDVRQEQTRGSWPSSRPRRWLTWTRLVSSRGPAATAGSSQMSFTN
ncbi:hypothetical protein ACP70R_048443 [Stipagrostis hirtigluma subsp. patula]